MLANEQRTNNFWFFIHQRTILPEFDLVEVSSARLSNCTHYLNMASLLKKDTNIILTCNISRQV